LAFVEKYASPSANYGHMFLGSHVLLLRRTARTMMPEIGIARDVAEAVLGHIVRGVEGVYQRYEYYPASETEVGCTIGRGQIPTVQKIRVRPYFAPTIGSSWPLRSSARFWAS
jgi:hypothetical protein